MKKFFSFFTLSFLFLAAYAQPNGAMNFAGPSTFGMPAMNAWQNNSADTIVFRMTSTTEADITLPDITYTTMNLTIPGFTIHGLKFNFDLTTRNAVFAEQTYSEAIIVGGEEKVVTGSAFTATYLSASQSFELSTTLTYGRMPFPIQYSISATYVNPSTGFNTMPISTSADGIYYNLIGQPVANPVAGQIYIRNGKKIRL